MVKGDVMVARNDHLVLSGVVQEPLPEQLRVLPGAYVAKVPGVDEDVARNRELGLEVRGAGVRVAEAGEPGNVALVINYWDFFLKIFPYLTCWSGQGSAWGFPSTGTIFPVAAAILINLIGGNYRIGRILG